jgi:hypothetical protein
MSDTTSPRRRAAVEAAAEKAGWAIHWHFDDRRVAIEAIAAYLAVMGRDVEAQQVRRMADERA